MSLHANFDFIILLLVFMVLAIFFQLSRASLIYSPFIKIAHDNRKKVEIVGDVIIMQILTIYPKQVLKYFPKFDFLFF